MNKITILLLTSILFLTGCGKELTEINENPNATDKVPTPYILTYAQRQLGYYLFDSWRDLRQSGVSAQMWSQRNYTSEDRYQFRREVSDGYFRTAYIYMYSYQDIIKLNTDEKTKLTMVQYGDNNSQIASAKLLQIYGIQMLAETFGDVPYTEALQPEKFLTPKYVKQSELFPMFIQDIDDCIAKLKEGSGKVWTQGDIIFKGDRAKWIKFANSLKLRIAVRISNVYPDWKTVAQAAIADGVFASNSDNAIVQFLGDGAPNEAPIYEAFKSRNDFTLTKQYLNLLRGLNDTDKGYINPFNGLVDPRLDIIVGSVNVKNNRYDGIPYGMPDSETKAFVNNNGKTLVNLRTSPRPLIASAEYGTRMLDYPTICYLKSEVLGWDRGEFKNGLEASMEMWGASGNAVTKYVDDVLALYDAASLEGKKEIILTQKYMHLLTQSAEAWAEYRRTGYPKSLVKPGEKTYKEIEFTPTNDTKGEIVGRLLYDSNEYKLNNENVTTAASSIGGDSYATQLWWAKK